MGGDGGGVDSHHHGGVPKFHGGDETKYPGWKLMARARLFKLSKMKDFDPTTLGSELLLMLEVDGPAYDVVKDVDETTIRGEAGAEALWTLLCSAKLPPCREWSGLLSVAVELAVTLPPAMGPHSSHV